MFPELPQGVMQNCIEDINTKELYIFPFGVTLQIGQSVATRDSRRVDGSKRSQNLVRRMGVQARTATIAYELRGVDVTADALDRIESLVGREVGLYYNQQYYDEYCVVEATTALEVDGVNGITAISVSLSLTERFVKPPTRPVIRVSTL